MPTIHESYQNAEWSVLCSALEQPKRFYELRREFSRSDFRDESARAIWDASMGFLDAPDGLDNLRAETPLLNKLEDDLGRSSPVYHAARDVLHADRTGMKEDHEWKNWKARLREIIRRHQQAVLEDKLKRAETTNEILSLAAQLTALQGGGKSSLTESASVDIAKYAAVSPRDYQSILPQPAWKGVQREGTLSIIAGASKAKKSWFVLSKLQHAVLGTPFLGREMIPPSTGKPRRALLLDFELPKSVLMSRYIALAGEFEEEERSILFDPQRVLIECHRGNMAISTNWIDYSCERIISFCNPGDVSVIDCLQPIMGDQDANLAQVVRPVIGKLQAAADSSGAAADLVDHFNKSGEGSGMNRISGSMAKAAGPDTIITLNSSGPVITVETDLRMDPPIDDLQVEFKPFEFRVISEEEQEERKRATKESKRNELLHETFTDHAWHSAGDLAKNLGISKEGARRRINKLRDDFLEEKKEGQVKYYRRSNNSIQGPWGTTKPSATA